MHTLYAGNIPSSAAANTTSKECRADKTEAEEKIVNGMGKHHLNTATSGQLWTRHA